MVRAVSLCILALVAVASTSAKSLRGSSAVAAAEQKPGVLSKLIRRAQDNDDDNDRDNDDDTTAAPVATATPTAKATAAGTKQDDCDCDDSDDDGFDDNDDSKKCACKPNLDVAVLQFALNLEYLEAEFYSWAAYGKGLPECAGNSTGGQKANLTAPFQAYAEEIAEHEIAHVKFLQTALGNDTIECPALDIGAAFSAAADAAVGLALNTTDPLSPPYSPYFDDKWFLLGAFIFEDVGVTAYNGAAPLLTDKGILGAAAGILAVEAYHAATVRTLLNMVKDELLTPYPLTVAQGVQAVSDLRAAVGGGKDAGIVRAPSNSTSDDDMDGFDMTDDDIRRLDHEDDIFKTNSTSSANATQIVPADENALAFARNSSEVLAIVYLGDVKTPGGFFPQGLNGLLR